MELALIIGVGILIVLASVLLWRQTRLAQPPAQATDLAEEVAKNLREQQQQADERTERLVAGVRLEIGESLKSGRGELSEIGSKLTQSVASQQKTVGEQLASMGQTLGQVSEKAKQMEEAAKAVARLQDILASPQHRGGLGEWRIETLLRDVLPADSFQSQYSFKDGAIVDFVVRVGGRLMPIDAKFPLENFSKINQTDTEGERNKAGKAFQRDVRGHVQAIADKYVRPEEGTYDCAFMFVPAEGVYSEIIAGADDATPGESLQEFALARHVVLASPNTLYAYLMVVAMGLRGMEIQNRAREIWEAIRGLEGRLEPFQEDFRVLGTHVNNAYNKYHEADKRLARFTQSLEGLTQQALPGEEDGAETASQLDPGLNSRTEGEA